jgi:hypothetical protein
MSICVLVSSLAVAHGLRMDVGVFLLITGFNDLRTDGGLTGRHGFVQNNLLD